MLTPIRRLTPEEVVLAEETLGVAPSSLEFVQRLLAGEIGLGGFDPRYLRRLEALLAEAVVASRGATVELYAAKLKAPPEQQGRLCDAMGLLEALRQRLAKALARISDEIARRRPPEEAPAPQLRPLIEGCPHEQQTHPASRGCRAPPRSSQDDDPHPDAGAGERTPA